MGDRLNDCDCFQFFNRLELYSIIYLITREPVGVSSLHPVCIRDLKIQLEIERIYLLKNYISIYLSNNLKY